jgi:hypothetical protein
VLVLLLRRRVHDEERIVGERDVERPRRNLSELRPKILRGDGPKTEVAGGSE